MYVANVDIACLEFSQMTFGDPKTNPRDARESAAANLLAELLKKADANREHTWRKITEVNTWKLVDGR